MNKIVACVDGLANSAAVIDWAAWSAQRLETPLELLHVIERSTEPSQTSDYSGAIGLGAQELLLQQLADLDGQRASLAQEAGRQLLTSGSERAQGRGLAQVQTSLRHGDLTESAMDMEPGTRLFVLGEHYHATPTSRLHLDHHVERVIRSVQRPVLVVTGDAFSAPHRFLLAFDGSDTSRKVVERVASSPLLQGLPALLVMVGEATPESQRQIEGAAQVLKDAGFDVETRTLVGEPEHVLPATAQYEQVSLIVMGAYGHSRIRHLIAGSTTTTVLRVSTVPVLILR